MQHDPLSILLTHNTWATRNIIEACAKLTRDQFHQEFDMGSRTLHDTILHILGAMRGWSDVLGGRETQTYWFEEKEQTPDQMLKLLDEIADRLDELAHAHKVDEVLTPERDGKQYTFTRGGILTHITTHGMHHRAQCLNMLRQLGVDPLPPTAVVEWMLMVDE